MVDENLKQQNSEKSDDSNNELQSDATLNTEIPNRTGEVELAARIEKW